MLGFLILLFMRHSKVRTSRGFSASFTFAQAENILFSLLYHKNIIGKIGLFTAKVFNLCFVVFAKVVKA